MHISKGVFLLNTERPVTLLIQKLKCPKPRALAPSRITCSTYETWGIDVY